MAGITATATGTVMQRLPWPRLRLAVLAIAGSTGQAGLAQAWLDG